MCSAVLFSAVFSASEETVRLRHANGEGLGGQGEIGVKVHELFNSKCGTVLSWLWVQLASLDALATSGSGYREKSAKRLASRMRKTASDLGLVEPDLEEAPDAAAALIHSQDTLR